VQLTLKILITMALAWPVFRTYLKMGGVSTAYVLAKSSGRMTADQRHKMDNAMGVAFIKVVAVTVFMSLLAALMWARL
jgi:prolipoprotein diacylglyceryltransferase